MTTKHIPGLGEVTYDDSLGWHYGPPMPLAILNGETARVVVSGYDDDKAPEEFHAAIAGLLACSPAVLKAAEEYIFQYYQDINDNWEPEDEEFVAIESAADVWRHVRMGEEAHVSRRDHGDHGVYVSLGGECDWEPEHGLQIVLKDGKVVTRVSPFDGHLTNSDAYANPKLENVVYKRR
jgi:hypothetical protein